MLASQNGKGEFITFAISDLGGNNNRKIIFSLLIILSSGRKLHNVASAQVYRVIFSFDFTMITPVR